VLLGSPVTWLIDDVLVVALYALCVVHATRRPEPTNRVLMLLGFTLFAGAFENVGVWTGGYFYDAHRIAMVGKVPLGVLLLESVIFYAAITLIEHLRLPTWAKPLAAGFLTTFQDFAIDPTAVHDTHAFGGAAFGQWTWAQHYQGTYAGIPFHNFTGWFYFTFAYVVAFELIMWLYRRKRWTTRQGAQWALPFATTVGALILLVNPLAAVLVDLSPIVPAHTRWAEMVMLAAAMVAGLVILLTRARPDRPFDLQRDGLVVFAIPLVLHVYDIMVAFARGITIAYPTSLVVTALHALLLFALYRRAAQATPAEPPTALETVAPEAIEL
jgi:hypothetical protein